MLADLTTVIGTRLKPRRSTEAFAKADADKAREVAIHSEDLATVLLRFEGGAKGACRSARCAPGTRTGCGSRSTARQASLRWRAGAAERAVDRPTRHRQSAAAQGSVAAGRAAQRYAHLPGGHQEGWAGRILQRDARRLRCDRRAALVRRRERPPAFPTFEDGYHSACVVEAILKSHANGNTWTVV